MSSSFTGSAGSAGSAAVDFAYELKALVPELNAALAAVFRPLGLSCVQADALMALRRSGPVTLGELSDLVVAESGHPSRLVARLEAAGLVSRDRSPVDGRALLLTLTPRGSELACRAEEARRPLAEQFAARYADDLGALTDSLRRIRRDLAGAAGTG